MANPIYLGLNSENFQADYDAAVAAITGPTPYNIVWSDGEGLGHIDKTGCYTGHEFCWSGSTKACSFYRPVGNIDYNIVGFPLGFAAACGTAMTWNGVTITGPSRYVWDGSSTHNGELADLFCWRQAIITVELR